MKYFFFLVVSISTLAKAQQPGGPLPPTPVKSFPLQLVRLLPGIFKDAQQTDMNYMLALDPDRLLAPYLKEAGLKPKKENYPNWENTGLDGHIGGHYLSALSYMYASTNDARMNQRLDYMLSELKRCQDKIGSGYLGGMPGGIAMWKEIAQGKITSDTFALNGKWVPLYNLHKLLAGLRDAYAVAGKKQAKEMLIRVTDFIDQVSSHLSDEQIQNMLYSEHGGLNEIFADVSVMTGHKKYLDLARRYSHRKILDPLIAGTDKLDGEHANMQIPKAVGFQRISEVGGDADYGRAASFFWETVVGNRSVVIGGNSVNEHFNPMGDYSKMLSSVAGPETCNSYNMLKLTKHLYERTGGIKYVDYYERTLYNHILSSEHPVTGGFVYYTPMRPGHYRVYSSAQDCMWCCVGSGMENHGKYGEMIYAHTDDELFVNLFIASRLNWPSKGLVISQQTNFPDEETTQLVVESIQPGQLQINIRFPGWVDADKLEVKVNGTKVSIEGQPGSYIGLNRSWKKGDRIEVKLPMKINTEALGNSGYVAFLHGPIVLAAKTGTADLDNLIGSGTDQFGGYRAKGKFYSQDELPVLMSRNVNLAGYVKPVPGKTQTYTATELIQPASFKKMELIPFYKLHDARYIIYWKKESL